jgi:hypothetical protein
VSHYTPSTTSIERPPPVPDNTPTLVCLSCGDTMKLLRAIPKLGVRAEQLIFLCPSCKGVDTRELIRACERFKYTNLLKSVRCPLLGQMELFDIHG